MRKIKPGRLTEGTVNFKEQLKGLLQVTTLKEIACIINKLNNLGLSDKELKKFSYQERYNLLNNIPVIVARHFQYKSIFQRNHTREYIVKNKILCYTYRIPRKG